MALNFRLLATALLLAVSGPAHCLQANAASDLAAADQSVIRIGLIDTAGTRLAQPLAAAQLSYAAFGLGPIRAASAAASQSIATTTAALPHGVTVATLIAGEARRAAPAVPIHLYSADIFRTKPDGQLALEPVALDLAFDWLAENGVRVVCLAFATSDKPALRRIYARAQARGLILVAAVPNSTQSAQLWPAAYRGTIVAASLAPAPEGLGATAIPAFRKRPVIRADGRARLQFGRTLHDVSGNSFATARVTGLAAALLHTEPGLDSLALQSRLQIEPPAAGERPVG